MEALNTLLATPVQYGAQAPYQPRRRPWQGHNVAVQRPERCCSKSAHAVGQALVVAGCAAQVVNTVAPGLVDGLAWVAAGLLFSGAAFYGAEPAAVIAREVWDRLSKEKTH